MALSEKSSCQDLDHSRATFPFVAAPITQRLQNQVPVHQAHFIEGRTITQQMMVRTISPRIHDKADRAKQQQYSPESRDHAQAWSSEHPKLGDLGQQPSAPGANGFYTSTSLTGFAGDQRPTWAGAAFQAFRHNNNLPMNPMAVADNNIQADLDSHYAYGGFLEGGSTVVKNEALYGGGSSWDFPTQEFGPLPQACTVDGSEFDTNTSSPSSKSYYSEPFSPIPRLGEADAGSNWTEYESTLPNEAKHSPSHNAVSSPPGFGSGLAYSSSGGAEVNSSSSHTATLGIASSMPQYDGRELNPRMDSFRSLWTPSTVPSRMTGALPFRASTHSQVYSVPHPYYHNYMLNAFQQGANVEEINGLPRGSYHTFAQPVGALHNVSNQDNYGSNRSTANFVRRKNEDKMLLEGKASGMTYKDIREKIGTDVAESTLRGRYRALTKARKDRVRKPVWTSEDIRLLEEIVAQELDRLDDGHRMLDINHRLSKVAWKKVAEYIVGHGGSYHFGNSTCKKKWLEVQERR
ncbi:hypothetical protein N0V90_012954 [Kalmusia sp. IMI 367209]|nr:hypothetical protein N0V90_012954 [Kalmusia sp. IMI 367209]